MKCFVCFKNMKYLISPEHENVDGGVGFKFNAHYGSCHDGYYGRIYICDSCIDSRINTVFIPDGNWIEAMKSFQICSWDNEWTINLHSGFGYPCRKANNLGML